MWFKEMCMGANLWTLMFSFYVNFVRLQSPVIQSNTNRGIAGNVVCICD